VADKLCFIEMGAIEVFTYVDGNEFILDVLRQGSVINKHSFLTEDINMVNYRCKEYCILLSITYQ